MKKIKLLKRLKKWFYNDVLNRYLIEYHPTFLQIISDNNPKIDFENTKSEREYKRIMKILNSQKFKKLFYKIVEHKIGEPEIYKHDNSFFGKIKRFVAKQYLRIFKRELYNNLLKFKKISQGFNILNADADKYIKNTTLDERTERAVEFGISSPKNSEAHIRMRNISDIRIAAIHERNMN